MLLSLTVEGDHKLDLRLAWTTRAVILIENRLRQEGRPLNALQNPSVFWTEMDCTTLAVAVWACALQEQPEYGEEDGFDTITSYMTPDNFSVAVKALKDCFLESLSKERRDEIKKAEEEASNKANEDAADPTKAPATA